MASGRVVNSVSRRQRDALNGVHSTGTLPPTRRQRKVTFFQGSKADLHEPPLFGSSIGKKRNPLQVIAGQIVAVRHPSHQLRLRRWPNCRTAREHVLPQELPVMT